LLDWATFFSAIALVLVVEGLLLFAGPEAMKKLYAEAALLDHKMLRSIGLGAIIAGVVLLYFIR